MAGTYKIFKVIFKWLASVIAVLLTILFVIQVIIFVHFDKIVEDTLKETVKNSTKDLYSIDFKNLIINVFTGSVTGKEVYLTPDTLLYNRLKDMGVAPTVLYTVYVPEVRISGVNLYNVYFDRHLDVHKIFIKRPEVNLLNEPLNQKNQEEEKKENPLDLFPLISSVFKKAEVKNIIIDEAKLVYKKKENTNSFNYSLSKLSLNFHKVLIDSTAFSDRANFFYSEDIQVNLLNHTFNLPGKLYNLTVGKSTLYTKASKIRLENVRLIPLHPKIAFAKVHGKQTDRISIEIKEVELLKINLKELLDKQKVFFEDVIIQDADIYAFRDKRIPFDKTRRPKMPQELIKSLDLNVNIRNVRLRNLNVTYEELPESGGEPGKVTFKRIFARITDINNDPAAIKNGQTMWITAEGYLMGEGLLKAKFKIPLNSPTGAYSYSGTLENLNLEEMNPVTKPLASIEIKEGKVNKMEFEVSANDRRATGNLKFYYNNLRIELLDKEKGEAGLKEKVGSFIANNFIVISDNPRNGEFRTGPISFERDQSKFIFNYWWKTILSGIKPSIGLDEAKQTSIKQFKNKWEEMKKKRQDRKKQRQQKNLAKKQKEE